MKKIFFLILLNAGLAIPALAQNNQRDLEKLQAYKVAFLSRKLDLTTEEAQKFWPIYNKYEAELRDARIERRGNKKEIEMEEKILNIRKKYNGEFEKAIPSEKVNQLFKSEREFNNIIQKEIIDRNRQKNNNLKRKRE
jgi:hypothetical protein